MARPLTLAAAIAVSLLFVSGAGGAATQQAPKRGGTVVFGPYSAPPCLNPFLSQCGSGFGTFTWTVQTVLPGAFQIAPDSTLRPRLVSGVDVVSDDPFTLVFHIRPQARWSDGTPVRAADFVFTHNLLLRSPDSAPDAHRLVDVIRTPDSKTVRVVLRQRVAEWRTQLFQFVAPRHALAGQDLDRVWLDGIDNPRSGTPIGSGAFLVRGWDRARGRLTFVRNRHYWGPHVSHLDRLVLRFCEACTAPPPEEVIELLREGRVDVSLNREPRVTPELRRIAGVRTVSYPSTGWEHLALRVNPPGGHPLLLHDKRIRRAIAYGIDRARIVELLFGVLDPRYAHSDSAAFSNTSRSYQANWRRYNYRPALARRLLEQSGCRRGPDRIYTCGSSRLSLRFVTVAGNALRERGIRLMQSHLREIGVEVVPEFAPSAAFFGQILPAGAFDVASFAWFSAEGVFLTKGLYGCGGTQNYTRYCQRLVTADLDQVERILRANRRALAFNRIDRRLAIDVPIIPLYQIPFVLAYRTSVRGIVTSPDNPLWNAENWWLDR